jgi:hypothetical protein
MSLWVPLVSVPQDNSYVFVLTTDADVLYAVVVHHFDVQDVRFFFTYTHTHRERERERERESWRGLAIAAILHNREDSKKKKGE